MAAEPFNASIRWDFDLEPALTRDNTVSPTPPAAFGRFHVVHQVGAGVLGPVFLGTDRDRQVAIKAFPLDITPERAATLAATLERLVATPLGHPSIVALLAAGAEGSTVYLAQEYVVAESVDAAVREYGPAPVPDALRLIGQLAGALDFAAAAGVHHGALHPRDVLVAPNEVRLTGLGIAQVFEELGLRVTPRRPYSAPERCQRAAWGTPADVFSLAAVGFEMLTGRRPGSAEALAAGTRAIPSPDPAALAEVFARALSARPADRYQSALTFAAALRHALTGEPIERLEAAARAAPGRKRARYREEGLPPELALFEPERKGQPAVPAVEATAKESGEVAREEQAAVEAPLVAEGDILAAAVEAPESVIDAPVAVEETPAGIDEAVAAIGDEAALGTGELAVSDRDAAVSAEAPEAVDLGAATVIERQPTIDEELAAIDETLAAREALLAIEPPAASDEESAAIDDLAIDEERPAAIEGVIAAFETSAPAFGAQVVDEVVTGDALPRAEVAEADVGPSLAEIEAGAAPVEIEAMGAEAQPPVDEFRSGVESFEPASSSAGPTELGDEGDGLAEVAPLLPLDVDIEPGERDRLEPPLLPPVASETWPETTREEVTMMRPSQSGFPLSSLVAMLVLGVAVGFAGGYLMSRGEPGDARAASREAAAAAADVPAASAQPPVAIDRPEPVPQQDGSAVAAGTTANGAPQVGGAEPRAAEPPRVEPPPSEPPRAAAPTTAARSAAPPRSSAQAKPAPTRAAPAGSSRRAVPPPASEPDEPNGRFEAPLSVISRPAGALVRLDGRQVGRTPLRLTAIRAGAHVVRLEMDGYLPWSSAIQVVSGTQNRVTASLERRPGGIE